MLFTFTATLRRARALALTLALLCTCAAWASDVGHVPYDIAGQWLINGEGYGEKSFLRLTLSLDGSLKVYTAVNEEGWRTITGYDIDLRIGTSRLDIRTWTDHIEERLHIPIPLPELRPTLNDPFELPAIKHEDLNYQVIFTSESSGKVKIYGYIDLDVVGTTEVNSESVIWKSGTTKPSIDDNVNSGCQAGDWGLAALAWLLGWGLLRRGA